MRRASPIKVKRMRDGGVTISINCLEPELNPIKENLEEFVRLCQDDTFGLHDRIRDLEYRERRRRVEEQTINLKVAFTKSTRKFIEDDSR